MKIAERIVMVLITLVLLGGGSWIYFAVKYEQKEVREAVSRGEYERPIENNKTVTEEDWREIYPVTVPLVIADVSVKASVADSIPERIKGLSGTPFLPDNVVKLFVFDAYGKHSIWMKDMNYAIDIMWVDKGGEILHIEENVSPDTYPKSFSSPEPAWFVIEAKAGFVASNTVSVGDEVILPSN